ncbi:MAG: hypothetical protein K2O99_01295 [Lachnospiraceae bacterium]|nr:hypothetical protein [Lachnospiraceae bacterium]
MRIHMLEYDKEIDHGDFETEEYNLIGLYPTEEEALDAKKRVASEMNIDEDLLFVSSSELGELPWEGGFVSSDELYQNFETLTACFNEWMGIDKTPEESWKDDTYHDALCDVEGAVYKIRDRRELAECIRQIWNRRFDDESRSFEEYMHIAGIVLSKLDA